MNELKRYIKNNQIEESLSQKELLELKRLIIKQKKVFIENRAKKCYLWEIDKKLKLN